MILTIKQKQATYEHLLTLDCPDLLAALIAERSKTDIVSTTPLSECIRMFDWWDETPEGEFWGELFEEVVDLGEDFEFPTEEDFAPQHEEVKIEIIPPPLWVRPVRAPLTYRPAKEPSFIDKVKLFFGKLFYKV